VTRLTLLPILCLAGAALADEPPAPTPAPPAAAPEAAATDGAAPADPTWRFYLRDGRIVKGRVIRRDFRAITVQAQDGTVVAFDEAHVRRADGPALPPRCEEAPGPSTVLLLRDGSEVRGVVTRRCDDRTWVALDGGGERVVITSDVVDSRTAGAPGPAAAGRQPFAWPTDFGRSRALSTPTAMRTPRGRLVLSVVGLGVTAEYAPLDQLSVSLSSTLPVMDARPLGANATARVTGGLSLGAHLDVAAGASAALGSGGVDAVFAFAAITGHLRTLSASAYVGPPDPATAVWGEFGDIVGSVSLAYRVGPRLLVLAEGVAGDGPLGRRTGAGAAARYVGDVFSAEVGAARVETGWVPWVGVAFAAGAGGDR
jgi:hypothetical protein